MNNSPTPVETDNQSVTSILQAAGLRKTKVTIYRTLSSFLEHGILHKALEDGQRTKYAFCPQKAYSISSNQKLHAHFTCDACGQTFCMEDVTVPEIKVTKDFIVKNAVLTLQGVCGNCQN